MNETHHPIKIPNTQMVLIACPKIDDHGSVRDQTKEAARSPPLWLLTPGS